MNERIRELYQQAHDVEEQTLYLIVPTMLPEVPKQVSRKDEIRTFNPEKFAELIVRECAKRSEELGQPELGKGLMKHFGVEE